MLRMGFGMQIKEIQAATPPTPAVDGKEFIATHFNANYVSTGIVPTESADWYWEVYGKFNNEPSSTYEMMGVYDPLDYSKALAFGFADSTWELLYMSGYEDIGTFDTDYHKFKVTGNGKLYIDDTLISDLSAAEGSFPDSAIMILSDPGDNFCDFTCIYSKIANGATVLQHLDFCTAKDGFVFDRVTGNQFDIEGTVDGDSWADQEEFNNLEEGYDIWKNDVDDGLIYVPYDLAGEPILTEGDTLTGYTWVSTHAAT
jgi:hypothetical protein